MTRSWLPVIVVAVTAVTAGCAYVPQAPAHEIHFDGSVERTDNTFRMDGQVDVDSGATPTLNFSVVSVVLYESPGDPADTVRLGAMSTDSSAAPSLRPVNITRNATPEYVLVESPDFWADGGLVDGLEAVVAFHWNGDEYERYWVESRDDRFDH